MPSLEQIAKGAKASGLTQKDFESRILANPRYSGVSREDIAVAWGGGLKKKRPAFWLKRTWDQDGIYGFSISFRWRGTVYSAYFGFRSRKT